MAQLYNLNFSPNGEIPAIIPAPPTGVNSSAATTTKDNSTPNGGLYSNYNQDNVLLIRDQPYLVEVWMYNNLAKFKPINIPVYFIEELVIEEELHSWYINGSITLLNDYEIFERGALEQNYKNAHYPQQDAKFLFRSDARNKIAIRIKPLPPPNNNATLLDSQWQMSYDCIVYEIEDLNTGNVQKKLKKLNFVDERYQIFSERNIEWSTSLYNNGKSLASTTGSTAVPTNDASRTMSCSEAIKSIITTACADNSKPDGTLIKVGSSQGPSGLANPTFNINNFSSNWDTGSSDSYVQYTSPANSNVLDDIAYVFSGMKAADGSPLYLMFDRYDKPTGKQFSLVPLSQFFNDAQKNQIERLIIQDGVDNLSTPPYLPRAPINFSGTTASTVVNFQSSIASNILSYEFVPMTAADDFSLNNTLVHSYDFSKSQFNIEFKGNKVVDFYNNMKNYTGGLYGYNNSKQLLLNINQTKQKGLSLFNKFISKTFFPAQIAGVEMMSRFLLLNQAISFTVAGLTFRSPSNFIFIDRDTSTANNNPFDDKALGQWMITKVVHTFSKNQYINNVIAVKVDAFTKWWEELDPVSNNQGSNNY